MDFSEEEKDVLSNALRNYHEAISDALSDDGLMSKDYDEYFNNRLIIIEYLISRIDPKNIYI